MEVLPSLVEKPDGEQLLAPAIKALAVSIVARGPKGVAPVSDALESQCVAIKALRFALRRDGSSRFEFMAVSMMCLFLSQVRILETRVVSSDANNLFFFFFFFFRYCSLPLTPAATYTQRASATSYSGMGLGTMSLDTHTDYLSASGQCLYGSTPLTAAACFKLLTFPLRFCTRFSIVNPHFLHSRIGKRCRSKRHPYLRCKR